MNPKIEKLEKEIDKTKTKIAEMQTKLRDLETAPGKAENGAGEYRLCGDCPQLPSDTPAAGRISEIAAVRPVRGWPAAETGG